MKTLFVLLIISVASLSSSAQTNWKVGDKVQVRTSSMDKWDYATIYLVLTDRTPTQYKAKMDVAGKYSDDYPLLRAEQVRSINAKPSTTFSLNSRVDLLYTDGSPHTRATVIEVLPGGSYKVALDGCPAKWNEVVDWNQLKAATSVSNTHPDITAIIGKWALFTPSYPNTVIHNTEILRQYGTGAKSPPLQVNANGTYIWYNAYNKPPVSGPWITDAKVEGLTSGIESFNGIIIADHDYYYKVYRDRADHIVSERLCVGTTDMGSRIK